MFDVDHLSGTRLNRARSPAPLFVLRLWVPTDLSELEELRLAQCTLEGTAIVSRTLRSMFLHDVWRFPAKPIITFDCPRVAPTPRSYHLGRLGDTDRTRHTRHAADTHILDGANDTPVPSVRQSSPRMP